MSLSYIILENDIGNTCNMKIASIISDCIQIIDTVSIISESFSSEIHSFCRNIGVNIISKDYIVDKELVSSIKSFTNNHQYGEVLKFLTDDHLEFSKKDLLLRFGEYINKEKNKLLYEHSVEVAEKAECLCIKFNVNPIKGYIAGLFHDIGGIFPYLEREIVADSFNLELFEEERVLPMIIHQKISANILKLDFHIDDEEVLQAVKCHTTLRKHYTDLDLIVFLADKIKWDRRGIPPYLKEMNPLVNQGKLTEAAYFYINYLMNHDIKVLHPWLKEAKEDLETKENLVKYD